MRNNLTFRVYTIWLFADKYNFRTKLILDQGIIVTFKTYYTRCLKRILNAIDENSEATVTSSWKILNIANCIPEINALLIELKESS